VSDGVCFICGPAGAHLQHIPCEVHADDQKPCEDLW